jgi:hypothetical protein
MVGKGSLEAKFESRADCTEGEEHEEEAKKWRRGRNGYVYGLDPFYSDGGNEGAHSGSLICA